MLFCSWTVDTYLGVKQTIVPACLPAYHPDWHTGRDPADIQTLPSPVCPAAGQAGRLVQNSSNLQAQSEQLFSVVHYFILCSLLDGK
jgi:hypothetical protein